jgi:hypothetical protein
MSKNNLPEAGGVAFATIYSKSGVPISVTAHAATLKDAIRELLEAISWATKEYGMTVERPAQPTAPPLSPITALFEGDKGISDQHPEVPPSRKGPDVPYQVVDADIVEFLPKPNNRVTIKFYQVNEKYPRIVVHEWAAEEAQELMRHVTSEDVTKPGRYWIPCRVYYTNGAPYITLDGEIRHYKDVEHVRPR